MQFLGIAVRDDPKAARNFVERLSIPYPSFDDSSGDVLAEFGAVLPMAAVPSTVFVDREGRLAARVVGRVDAATLTRVIEDLRAEGRSANAGRAPSPVE